MDEGNADGLDEDDAGHDWEMDKQSPLTRLEILDEKSAEYQATIPCDLGRTVCLIV
jgi:hypothetical protein